MKPQDVLLQLLEENERYIHNILQESPDECLHWRANDSANSIAHLIWHVARVCDVFYTQNIQNQPADQELWVKNGWQEKSDYTPFGLGVHGWGMLTRYTAEEVTAIPKMSKEVLLGYFDDICANTRDYLSNTELATLEKMSLGYNSEHSNWFWVRHPLFDMTRHVGEILSLKGLWEQATQDTSNH